MFYKQVLIPGRLITAVLAGAPGAGEIHTWFAGTLAGYPVYTHIS